MATCKANNKVYIGKTINSLEHRKSGHKYKAQHPDKSIFSKALNKHGFENFDWSVLEECATVDELNIREIFYINEYKSQNRKIGYNMTSGGEASNTLKDHPNLDEIRKKISTSMKIHHAKYYKGKTYEEMYGQEVGSRLRQKRIDNNIMNTKNVYECWIDKYGKEEADKKQEEWKEKISLINIKPKTTKVLTEEQKREILKLYNSGCGLTVTEISKKLKITRYKIKIYLFQQGFKGNGLALACEIKYLNK